MEDIGIVVVHKLFRMFLDKQEIYNDNLNGWYINKLSILSIFQSTPNFMDDEFTLNVFEF
jgi:hypothetical protein